MSKKITLKTVENILKEVELAARDDHRVISDIDNRAVKEIVKISSDITIKKSAAGIALGAGGAAAVGAAGAGAIIGGGAAAGGAAGGAILGGGAAAGGVAIMGLGGGGAAAAGASAGAAAGSVVPVVGTIIGAAAGLGIGVITGLVIGKQQKNKRESLNQEILSKQNAEINILIKECEQLRKELYEKTAENVELQAYAEALMKDNEELKKKIRQKIIQNKTLREAAKDLENIIARLRYHIGILTAFGDIKGLLGCSPV